MDTSDAALFRDYAARIRGFLKSATRDKSRRISDLVQSLTLGEQGLHVDLGHGRITTDPVSIVRDTIPLPGTLLLKSKPFLRRLYHDEGLSARAIAHRIGVGQSTVSDAIQKHGLAKDPKDQAKSPQHVPFGYDLKNGKLVSNRKEQQIISTAKQLRAAGLTYRDIAAHLNRKLVPTKIRGVWGPMSVRRILVRAHKNQAQSGEQPTV